MPDVLKNKSYRQYDHISRYSIFPYYYHTIDNKYIYGTTKYLNNETAYTMHKVVLNDTYDSLALQYYNNPTLYWIICSYNHVQDPFIPPKEGINLKIPVFSSISYNSNKVRG